MITATVNAPSPSRLQLSLGTLQGPLSSTTLGSFNPGRDLEIYVDGKLLSVQSFSYDVLANRYLVYVSAAFNLTGVVQVLHHMPSAPFTGSNGTLPGMALRAAYSTAAN